MVCRLDWMHVVDLGVAQDWLGQVFVYLLPKMNGESIDAQVADLWSRIQLGYGAHPPVARLDTLTVNMLSPTGASPKLKCYAVEGRSIIPIATDLCRALLNPEDPLEQAVATAMEALNGCYECLSSTEVATHKLPDTSCRFASLYVALADRCPPFRIKPKLHLFQELCEEDLGADPSKEWTYQDEDFGGSLASLAKEEVEPGLQRHKDCKSS